MASKRKRTVLTVEDRVKCIRLSESGYKVKDIQNQLGVGKTQIYGTLKNKDSILAQYNAGSLPGDRKLLVSQLLKFSVVNERVLEWFNCCRATYFPLTGPLIRGKGKLRCTRVGN